MKKKILLGLLGAAVVSASVFGAAASLGVLNSDNLGAAGDAVGSCDVAGPPTTSYTVAYNDTDDEYMVTAVSVGAVDALCNGETLTVTLSGAGGTSLTEETQAVSAAPANQSVTISPAVPAEDVENIDVVITGPNS